MEFLPLQKLPQAPAVVSGINEHTRFFHTFRHPLFIRQHHPITAIHFSPTKPHRFAVTASSRVLIYAPKTGKVVKTITRFKETARGAEIRRDGKLVVAGGDDGLVQVFDVNSRAILRTMKEHTLPVHVTRFSPTNTEIMSCSDDTTVKLWDIPSQTALRTFVGHTDYVRSGHFIPSNPSLLLSGSYDSTVRLWDARAPAETAALVLRHGGAPVEDVLPFSSGGVALSVGGPILRVWDLAAGRCVRALSNHQKTVTCLAFDGEKRRVLTGGLDQTVKVYDVEDWKVVHTMRYPAPILSLAVSPDNTHIAAGMTDGTLSVRRRDPKATELAAAESKRNALTTGAFEYFADFEASFDAIGQGNFAGRKAKKPEPAGEEDEMKVEKVKRRKLQPYDKFLKSFQYGAALDAVMKPNTRPAIAFALIQELTFRDGLRQALRNRDDVSLEPVLRFLVRNVADPRFGSMAAQVAEVVIALYSHTLGQSPIVDDLFARLRRRVAEELRFENELLLLKGALDMVVAQAALSQAA